MKLLRILKFPLSLFAAVRTSFKSLLQYTSEKRTA
ncbi:unnamed protein product [Tenebrio molitor]|nr:unnamed protein product [Tenebrio molitor]